LLFLSDIGAELDAAWNSGWRTCQLLRDGDGAEPSQGHQQAGDFDEVTRRFGIK